MTLRAQLRSQSAGLDHFQAENTDQRAIIKSLHFETARLRAIQQTDSEDLLHLAGRLLALSHAVGVVLDGASKELFRRRGWTTAARQTEARQ